MGVFPNGDTANWLLRLEQGDEKAFEWVFSRYYSVLCVYAETFSVDSQTAADVVEDMLLSLWQSKSSFNSEDHLKAFLYRSIHNACLNALRRDRRAAVRQFNYLDEQEAFQEDYLNEIVRAEAMMQLYRAIDGLPTQAARIIRMTYLEGRSNQETADLLGLSINTVKAQKQRGLAILRERLPNESYLLLIGYAAMEIFFHRL